MEGRARGCLQNEREMHRDELGQIMDHLSFKTG